MSKTLIIAEKQSVANDIAKTLGGFTKYNEYFESDKYVLSSAIGHLLEIAVPEEYNIRRGKWTFTHLPIIPPHFILNPIAKTEVRLKLLTKLIKRKDIIILINACDAGREGELIFRLIIQYTKVKKPIKRLWLQSMTSTAIKNGFTNLRDDKEMLPLANAARCRSEADWLIGINGTRAMTAFNSKEGGFYLTTVGRVQTPTLSIVIFREKKIKTFVPTNYWEIHAVFICKAGIYKGRWTNTQQKENKNDIEKNVTCVWKKKFADTIVNTCWNKAGTVVEKSKKITKIAPRLFDLTSLQREANLRFGFSAKNTLMLAQTLYEKYKVLTYPRTNSHYLPEDYLQIVYQVLEALSKSNDYYCKFALQILNKNWIKLNKRIFDNNKINDHFAIIPTTQIPKKLREAEQKIYDLIKCRFIAVFFPSAEFQVTVRYTNVSGCSFRTDGKIMIYPGWLAIYGKNINNIEKDNKTLVPVKNDEKIQVKQISAIQLITKPPVRYTEATLLSAMESAGKLIDLEELRDAMANKGLGTPATRAAIIEGLLNEKYLIREKQEIIPTTKAFQLMTLLHGLGINELTEPELTGEWEYKLAMMELGQISRDEFMHEIIQMTQIIVKRAKEYNNNTIPGDYATLQTPCPNCKNIVKENYQRFSCVECKFSITKIPSGRQFEIAEVEELLINHIIGPLHGFRSKNGRLFTAILKIERNIEINNYKLEFDFYKNDIKEKNNEIINFNKQVSLGKCPKCNNNVYEIKCAYTCEKAMINKKTCDFRSSRMILQQEILPEQMIKLLDCGKTDLLSNFISQRTHRSFKAFLICNKNGKISFAFEDKKLKTSKNIKQ